MKKIGISDKGIRRIAQEAGDEEPRVRFPGAQTWGLKDIDAVAPRTEEYIRRMDEQGDPYDIASISTGGGEHVFKFYPDRKLIIVFSDGAGLLFRRFRDEAQMQEVWQSMDQWVAEQHQMMREHAEARGERYWG